MSEIIHMVDGTIVDLGTSAGLYRYIATAMADNGVHSKAFAALECLANRAIELDKERARFDIIMSMLSLWGNPDLEECRKSADKIIIAKAQEEE